ncbi:transposase [Streptomyces olivoreticuli]|uniref:transposase n=1 Tax=Streptomyces olivoreticuli TaxID=68246 RepID=UPI003CC7FF39
MHLAGEGGRRPPASVITPGQWGDAPQLIPVLERIRVPRPGGGHPRTRPDHLGGDKAYPSRQNRRYLRRRQIKHTIPERKDQRANRPAPRQRGRPSHRLRQDDLQTPQRSQANDQRPQGLPRHSHPLRQKGVYLPQHRHRCCPSPMASLMTFQTVPRQGSYGPRRVARFGDSGLA